MPTDSYRDRHTLIWELAYDPCGIGRGRSGSVVIDDHPQLLELCKAFLESHGYPIKTHVLTRGTNAEKRNCREHVVRRAME